MSCAQPASRCFSRFTIWSRPQLAFGRVALLGDAAFVARPHVGLGVTKAAGDAVALVDALAAHSDLTAGLKVYAAKRLEFGKAIVAHARTLGLAIGAAEISGPQAGADRTSAAARGDDARDRGAGLGGP